jgi:hypothetical protein
MNAWAESMAELMKLGRIDFDSSFSAARILLSDARFYGIIVLFAVFCLLCAWEDRWLNDHQSDTDRE